MPKGYIRHMFPGGNTAKGFFSFYDNIIRQEVAEKIYIIKGGPGVGKSTFMKKTAVEMAEHGYNVEYMHCSSDNDSLDGIVIPEVGIALIDGTAPHVVDPKNPGAVDEIIHLGDYWDEAGMRKNRDEIIEANREVGRLFARAYRYLKAASCIYEDWAAIYSRFLDEAKINMISNELKEEIFCDIPVSSRTGRPRCLFISAITPDGLKNYLNELLIMGRVFLLKGFPGAQTEKVLELVKNAALERGFNVEAYYCALHPEKLEHVIIPQLDTAFATVNRYHGTDACINREFDFLGMIDEKHLGAYRDDMEFNCEKFEELLDKAIATIYKAKKMHDLMETYYIPNMDFDAVQGRWESMMEKIMSYADAKAIY